MSNQYDKWISYIFDHEATEPSWYFDTEAEEFVAEDDEIVELILLTCQRCGSDLQKFSDAQVDQGLSYLFSNLGSDYAFSIKEADLYHEDKAIVLRAIKHLYTDLFDKRCSPVLSYLDEPCDNRLNSICYMFWDVTPLSYWESDPNKDIFYKVIAEVMEHALYLQNDACVESGLHGLGHIRDEAPSIVIDIISKFLDNRKNLRPELKRYAYNAKKGFVL